MDYLSIALGRSGRGPGTSAAISRSGRQSRWAPRRAAFVLADPGYDTATTLRSWRAAQGGEVPPFVSPGGLKPIADGIRKILPFGPPKGGR